MPPMQSSMPATGTPMPPFTLTDVRTGSLHTRESLLGSKGLLVMFICSHCPYVQHVEEELARIGAHYQNSGVGIVAISSNDAESYPEDAPPALARRAAELGFVFPYLYDETQEVAHAFAATCTPDFFLFDAQGLLVYRGQLDGSRPGNGIPVTGKDLRGALGALLAGEPIAAEQQPSIGCSIKWKTARPRAAALPK